MPNSFDLKTGTPADITPRKLSAATAGFYDTYDAIMLPGLYAADKLTVNFEINGETFTWEVGAIEFEPGHEYIYKVRITRTGVTATGTITTWTPVMCKDEVKAE